MILLADHHDKNGYFWRWLPQGEGWIRPHLRTKGLEMIVRIMPPTAEYPDWYVSAESKSGSDIEEDRFEFRCSSAAEANQIAKWLADASVSLLVD